MNKRIAILSSDGPHHRYLIAALRASFNVVAILIESDADQRQRLFRRRKFRDYFYRLYHHARRTVLGLNRYRRRYFALSENVAGFNSALEHPVQSINGPEALEILQRSAPDATIVMGTSILRPATISAAGELILNIHGGLLPYYRGNHCFFFAMYNGEFSKIGSTIHFIDQGIDTGDIVETVVVDVHRGDTPEMLYCRAEKLAIERLVYWLEWTEQGGGLPRTLQTGGGRTYRTRDRKLHHDIRFFFRRITGRLWEHKITDTLPTSLESSGEKT